MANKTRSRNPFTLCADHGDTVVVELRPLDERTRLLREVAALERDIEDAQRVARAAAEYRAAILDRPKDPKRVTHAHQERIARAWLTLCDALDEQGVEATDPNELERLRDVDAIAGEAIELVENVVERQRLRPMEWGAARVLDELAPIIAALVRARAKDADAPASSEA